MPINLTVLFMAIAPEDLHSDYGDRELLQSSEC